MNYIVLDMEWNQSYPKATDDPRGEGRKKRVKNEIIEIGAVKLDENMNCLATYKRLIRPVFIKRLNSHVKKLTGITSKMLESGGYFPDIIAEFREWCGPDMRIITWGPDDVPVLISCLKLYGMDADWIGRWYDLQIIFNVQTDSGSNQKSLKSALEHFNCAIDDEHPWHDALNDACYTALICRHLDIKTGIEQYGGIGQKTKEPSVLTTLREVARSQQLCTPQTEAEVRREMFNVNPCPFCGADMTRGAWVETGRRKPMTVGECHKHGKFLLRIRIVNHGADKVVRKIIYECTPEAENIYLKKIKKRQAEKNNCAKNEANV